MKITSKRAKELTIEVWTYLADHPWLHIKFNLPELLLNKLYYMKNLCPLCEYMRQQLKHGATICTECPLISCQEGSDYYKWCDTKTVKKRKIYATNIVNKVKSWEIE